MNFTIKKNVFQTGLTQIENIISIREIRSVLSNILIDAKKDSITLTSSDYELILSTTIPAKIQSPGKIMLPAKKLNQIINQLKTDEVSFIADENKKIEIKDSKLKSSAKITLIGLDGNEYPISDLKYDNNYHKIPSKLLLDAFHCTSYAMAKDDPRYVFNGMYIEPKGNDITFVCTDGRRLSLTKKTLPEPISLSEPIILPNKVIRELQRIINEEEFIYIAYDDKNKKIHFKVSDTYLLSKLIDGNFPDYKKVIPKDIKYKFLINLEEFENSLQTVSIMAIEPSRQVRFNFKPNELQLIASTPDIGEAEAYVSLNYNEEEINTSFNSNYIKETLKAIKEEDFFIGISSYSSPIVIQRKQDENFISVIMPMKV